MLALVAKVVFTSCDDKFYIECGLGFLTGSPEFETDPMLAAMDLHTVGPGEAEEREPEKAAGQLAISPPEGAKKQGDGSSALIQKGTDFPFHLMRVSCLL